MMRLVYLFAVLAIPTLSLAAGPPPAPNDGKRLDFAVEIAKAKTVFDYSDGASFDTTLRTIGISWYEHMAPGIELGMYGGHLVLDQNDNPFVIGVESDGYYGGLGLRSVLVETTALQLFVHVTYTHRRVDHNDGNQSVTLSWDESQAKIGVSLALTRPTRLYGGIGWSAVDGQEHLRDPQTETTDFDRDDRTGGFLGLDFAVENNGYVGTEFRWGMERGGEIYFKTRF